MKVGDKVSIIEGSGNIVALVDNKVKLRDVLVGEIFTICKIRHFDNISLYDLIDGDGIIYKGFGETSIQLIKTPASRNHRLTNFFE